MSNSTLKVRFPQFVKPTLPVNAPVQRSGNNRPSAPLKIAIVRLGSVGDILMATPILTAIREAHPSAQITWIVEHTHRGIVDANPFIDEVIVWNGGFWEKRSRGIRKVEWYYYASLLFMRLRSRRFDIIIDCHGGEWPLLVSSIAARKSVGMFSSLPLFRPSDKIAANRRLYSDHVVAEELATHRTDQYIAVVKRLGIPAPSSKRMILGFTEGDQARVHSFLESNGIGSDDGYLIVAPMTNWPSRCWPLERYARLIERLAGAFTGKIVLIGSASEKSIVEQLWAMCSVPTIQTAGEFSVREAAALIAGARAVISGDTGPMHIAAAVGTAAISIFGSTPVSWLAPLAHSGAVISHDVPCGPCYRESCSNPLETRMMCMNLVTVNEVFDAVEKTLLNAKTDIVSET